MIADVAIYQDWVIIIEDSGPVTVMRVYEDIQQTQNEKDVIGVVHVDPNKTVKPYRIYRNSKEILEELASMVGCKVDHDSITQEIGKTLVGHLKRLK